MMAGMVGSQRPGGATPGRHFITDRRRIDDAQPFSHRRTSSATTRLRPSTGAFTRRVRLSSRANVGDRAGWKDEHGYVKVSIDYGRYYAHRLAWLYTHGDWPPEEIDHMNGDRADNRIANLRLATHSENSQHRLRARAKSGVRNVYPNRDRWCVQVRKDGRTHCFGTYDTVEQAAGVAKRERQRLFGDFAGAHT